jgi:hypothetical protein
MKSRQVSLSEDELGILDQCINTEIEMLKRIRGEIVFAFGAEHEDRLRRALQGLEMLRFKLKAEPPADAIGGAVISKQGEGS